MKKDEMKNSDIVVSTRVRYARNLDKFKFPCIMSQKEQNEAVDIIDKNINKEEYKLLKLKDIDDITKRSLVEKHYISKELIENENSAVVVNNDNSLIAMINEEDHLRIQSFGKGKCINECYEKLREFTDNLESKVGFAKSEDYGYLTACPTNVGSGMRVSVIVHLEALSKIGMVNKLLEQVRNLGISVRGFYGENTKSIANFYQISNKRTLGYTDKEIIDNFNSILLAVVEQEERARKMLLKNSIELEDDVYRSYGILKNARKISLTEGVNLLSTLSLGMSVGVIPNDVCENVYDIIENIEPNTLRKILKEDFEKDDENKIRAKYIREELK